MEKHNKEGQSTERDFLSRGIARFGGRLNTVINGEPYKSFASKCGMSDKAIRDYVNGKTYPSLDKIGQIAKAAGCSFEWLATGLVNHGDGQEVITSTNEVTRSMATEQQQQTWLSILDRMTPDERETVIDRVLRHGIGVLLASAQTASTLSKSQFPWPDDLPEKTGISHNAMVMAMMYDSMSDQERLKVLADIEKAHLSASAHKPSDKQAG